jgi:hypothetical protein
MPRVVKAHCKREPSARDANAWSALLAWQSQEQMLDSLENAVMANGEAEGRDTIIAPATAAEPTVERRPVRSTYHRLRMVGLSPREAGNLTAHLNGLRVADQGWTLHEIERLLFVRALVERGRLPS